MPLQNIKIAHESFNYFRFQISAKIDSAQLSSKLIQLYKLDNISYQIRIVLEFTKNCNIDTIEKIITEIQDIISTQNLNRIIICAITAKNLNFVSDNTVKNNTAKTLICGIPVVNIFDAVSTVIDANILDMYTSKTLTITDPVRSGMKITHDGDIVVANLVSNNAEVVSCGNIHVYDDAKGRLVAGSSGDKSARIFVSRFDAELIAIGGVYRTIDAKLPDNVWRKPVMIYLDAREKLNIVPLKI